MTVRNADTNKFANAWRHCNDVYKRAVASVAAVSGVYLTGQIDIAIDGIHTARIQINNAAPRPLLNEKADACAVAAELTFRAMRVIGALAARTIAAVLSASAMLVGIALTACAVAAMLRRIIVFATTLAAPTIGNHKAAFICHKSV